MQDGVGMFSGTPHDSLLQPSAPRRLDSTASRPQRSVPSGSIAQPRFHQGGAHGGLTNPGTVELITGKRPAGIMSSSCLLSIQRVAELGPERRQALQEAAIIGQRIGLNLDLSTEEGQRFARARAFVFKRWILDILVLMSYHRTMSFNQLRHALGGLASGSLAPKLAALVEHGFLVRKDEGDKVVYHIADEAHAVGAAIFVLTIGKADRYHGSHNAAALPMVDGSFVPTDAPDAQNYRQAVEAFSDLALQFSALHREAEGEHPVKTATRFTAACVRRHHGVVITVLGFSGGLTYTELRSQMDISDSALSKAINGLLEIRSIEKDSSNVYRLTPWGFFDLSLGCPVPALVARMWEQQGRYP